MSADAQTRINDTVWRRGSFVRSYANRALKPVEADVLLRHHATFAGRVLELGCGAGRLTGYLTAIAREVHGLDLSPRMVAYCRDRYADASVDVGDLRDLSRYATGSFDAVVAVANVLDVLGDAERCEALAGIRRVLADGGLLLMSSHNRGHASRLRPPTRVRLRRPRTFVGDVVMLPLRVRNRRRLRRYERHEPGYAILNDSAHGYSLLHYYVSPAAQRRQLEEQGFELLECLDLDGRAVEQGDGPPEPAELHYVARAVPAAR